MSTIDEVKARLDIVETVAGYVPDLKKVGRTYKALCPFHTERTPSFVVDPGRNSWHCFGACSTGGDVIEFVRRSEGLEFRDALALCAQRAGVELRAPSRREREQREHHDRLLRANEGAAVFFQAALGGPDGAEALRYAEGRGLDGETRKRWQLGYAPGGWHGLLEHLQARGFGERDLIDAGLAVEGDKGAYDRFRDRLIFPTRDASGRLVGFGARALKPEDEPKYLNTPQTPLFDKSATLYGLDRAGEAARRADRLVVVEGYMDVIAAHQFGIENVVASMGTSITDKQMNLVKRYTANVVLAMDADSAGSEATLRGIQVASSAAEHERVATVDWRGLVRYQDVLKADIRVVSMPPGQDPDGIVRADPEQFRTLVEAAQPVADHLFDALSKSTDAADPRSRSRALEAFAPTVAAMADPVVRAHYVQRLARLTQVDERVVLARLGRRQQRRGPAAVPSPAEQRREARQRPAVVADGETQLLQLLLTRVECRGVRDEIDVDTFEDSTNRRLFGAWRELDDLDERVEELDEDVRERYEAVRGSVPEALNPDLLESRYVEDRARDLAIELRGRRARERFRPAAVEHAVLVQAARQSGAAVLEQAARAINEGAALDEAASETDALAGAFAELSERQPALAREHQEQARRAPTSGGDAPQHGDREESGDDADL